MKFYAWISFGKGDNGETEFDLALSPDEERRMEELHRMGDDAPYFDDCPALADIYEKAHEAAVTQITKEQVEDGFHEPFTEDGEPWTADMDYMIGVRAYWECE